MKVWRHCVTPAARTRTGLISLTAPRYTIASSDTQSKRTVVRLSTSHLQRAILMAESLKKVAASGKEKAVSAGQAAISGMNALSTSATGAVGIAQPQSNTPGDTSEEGASPRLDADVIVLGAGISGLAAAAELVKRGNKVIVLEARDRTGGRIDSRAIGPQDSKAVRVDMGAR
jgi:hypothetical protein